MSINVLSFTVQCSHLARWQATYLFNNQPAHGMDDEYNRSLSSYAGVISNYFT
jgi:uncharacterized protein YqiB (DUF1249 family)